MMKRLAKETDETVHLGKEERENLLACISEGLRDESDNVLESIVEVVQDLKKNAGMREALENFHKNGWAFIQKTVRSKNEFEFEKSVVALEKPNQNLPMANRLDHETHPMHNELILKKIFEYSSVDSLKNCRLVSTKWRDLSLNSWREKAVLLASEVVNDGNAEDLDLTQDGPEFGEVPFKRYRLVYGTCFSGYKSNRKFLDTFGASIQYMNLRSTDVEVAFSVLTKLPELRAVTLEFVMQHFLIDYETMISDYRQCPFRDLHPASSTLRKFDLKISFMHNPNCDPRLRFPWKKMFEKLPSIESLCVQYKLEMEYRQRRSNLHITTFEDIMRSVCEVRREGNLSTLNLKELDIADIQQHPSPICLTERVAEYLIGSFLPLQALKLTLNTSASVNSSKISKLLKTYAEATQSLKCIGDLSRKYLDMNVLALSLPLYLPTNVQLPNLKELVFEAGCVWTYHVLGSLDVPELESLRIEEENEQQKWLNQKETDKKDVDLQNTIILSWLSSKILPELSSGAPLLPSLKKLFFDGSDAPISFNATELQCLGKALPNINELGISLSDIEVFPIVYELWPSLQALHVLLTDRTYLLFDDYTITGLPVADENEDGIGAESRKPSITNLKDLRKFVLETTLVKNFPQPRKPLITDLSATYGFLQLPKLRILKMETLCKFSPRIQSALESHLLEMKVKRPEPEPVNENDKGDNDTLLSDGSGLNFRHSGPVSIEEEEDTDDDTSDDSDSDSDAGWFKAQRMVMISESDEDE